MNNDQSGESSFNSFRARDVVKRRVAHGVIALLGATLLFLHSASGNTNMRLWRLKGGGTFNGEILDYDENRKIGVFLIDERVIKSYGWDEFSLPDQSWIIEWLNIDDRLKALVGQLGGTVDEYKSPDPFSTSFWVYRPSGVHPGDKLPLVILFDPSGQGRRLLLRFMEAAEKVRFIALVPDTFRNTPNDLLDSALDVRFKYLLPYIEKAIEHDPAGLYLGGLSGGAERAFQYSAEFNGPWAGIFSGGGWLGGQKYYNLPYPPMRVLMVNGNNDDGANSWTDSDSSVLLKRGCHISLDVFEGGHQIPPVDVQIRDFEWLLGLSDHI